MNDLRETLKTVNDDGVFVPEPETKQGLTVIVGAYNFVHAQNVVLCDGLPDTIEAVSQSIRDLPPESIDKIASSLEKLMAAIAELVAKNNK